MNTELKQMKRIVHFFNPIENKDYIKDIFDVYKKKLKHQTVFLNYDIKEIKYGRLSVTQNGKELIENLIEEYESSTKTPIDRCREVLYSYEILNDGALLVNIYTCSFYGIFDDACFDPNNIYADLDIELKETVIIKGDYILREGLMNSCFAAIKTPSNYVDEVIDK